MSDERSMPFELLVKKYGLSDYQTIWQAMRTFTDSRTPETTDEAWLVQHPPVFTQGQAGKPEHILNPADIPVIQTDRGGQVTYHGPGQLVLYTLFDLRRLNLGIRQLVSYLEKTVIEVLADFNIPASTRCDAPGVYIDGAKICSIGLRVRRGYTYHGIAFNVDMDLEPFSRINPCGFKHLPVTQVKSFYPAVKFDEIESKILSYLTRNFGYNRVTYKTENLTEDAYDF